MYTLSPLKSIKGNNYGEFLKDKNVLLMYTTVLLLTAYKYAPNLESLLTQQYVCIMCTLWSDDTCVFTRFYSVKNTNTQLIWSSVLYTINVNLAFINILICNPNVFICKLLVYGVKCHFQQYFSYIVAVSFIGGGNWRLEYHMKTTDLSQVFDKLYHIMLYCIEYTSPWTYWIKIYSTLLLSGRCHHTCLTLPHCCSCLKPRPRFPMPCVMVLPVFSCFEVRGGCSLCWY